METAKRPYTVTVVLLLLSAFLILKMLRAFSGSDSAGGLWNVIQMAFLVLGALKFLLNCTHIARDAAVKCMLAYTVLATVFALFSLTELTVSALFAFSAVPYAGLLLILFYYVGLHIDPARKNILYPTFYIISLILVLASLRYFGQEEDVVRGAIADVYYVLGLFPLVMAATRKKWLLLPILTVALAVILSTKRAGVLALVAMLLVFFLLEMLKTRKLKTFFVTLLVLCAVAVLLFGLFSFLDTRYDMELLQDLFELAEDGGSGRDVRWQRSWEAFCGSNLTGIVFGHGKGALFQIIDGNAHNDFLQVLYDHGILSLFAYIGFYVCLLATCVRMWRVRYPYVAHFAMSIICALFLSMFSFYVIDPTYVTCGMLCFGVFLADFGRFNGGHGVARGGADANRN